MYHNIIFVLIIFSISKITQAHDWSPLSNVQLVQYADLIICGKVIEKKGHIYIKIKEVLKGSNLKKIELKQRFTYSSKKLVENQKGIFFLQKHSRENVFVPFHPNSVKDLSHYDKIKEAIDIWSNPATFLNIQMHPENNEINYVLGEFYSSWKITCPQVPHFAAALKNYYIKIYKEVPWKEKTIVVLTIIIKDNDTIHFISNQPKSKLSAVFQKRVKKSYELYTKKEILPKKFKITINHQYSENEKTIYLQVLKYLRTRLTSNSPEIVISALHAIGKLGDPKSIPDVLPLLNHTNIDVKKAAVQFLGWSKDVSVIDSLGMILEKESYLYPKKHDLLNKTALALKSINHPTCLPYLEKASKYGIQRAIESLGAIGNNYSVDVLVQAMSNNLDCCSLLR